MKAASWHWQELEGVRGPGLSSSPAEDEARRRAEQAEAVEASYRRGLAEGEEAALAAVRENLDAAMEAARSTVDQVRRSREAWNEVLRDNLVTLATAMARHIVERELRQDPTTFHELARKAVAGFPADEPLRIRLHPADLLLLAGEDGNVDPAAVKLGDRFVRWVPDEEIVRGGCIVEGPDRIVDGRIDEALERIYWTLVDD